MKKYYWKVWLRPNLLTREVDNDYVAEVSTVGKTLRNADIARLFIESGSELQYETLLDILDRSDRIRREKLQEGCCVQTGICHLSPRVAGTWPGAMAAYNPATHRITLDIIPTAEMRTALTDVGVETLGIREGGACIGLVTDVTTGQTDGTLTPNGQIIIAGDKIKIEPATGDPATGVFLTDGANEYPLKPLAVNHPKEIIALAPSLPAGTYTLHIVTRYAGGNTLLKEPRRITCATPLIIT